MGSIMSRLPNWSSSWNVHTGRELTKTLENQYLIAVPLAIGPDNSTSGSPGDAMYYQNMNSIDLQNSSDIDNKSIQCIDNIQTKIKI